MKSLFQRTKKKVLFLLPLLFLIPTHFAFAAWWNPLSWVVDAGELFIGALLRVVQIFILFFNYILSWIFRMAYELFDTTLDYTIINFSNTVNGLSIINTTWELLQSFANIIFIFSLLYISIITILHIDNMRRALITLIVVMMLVNFSLVFTKTIIDIGNVFAVASYNKIAGETVSGESIGKTIFEGLDSNMYSSKEFRDEIKTSSDFPTEFDSSAVSTGDSDQDATTRFLINSVYELLSEIFITLFLMIGIYVFFSAVFLLVGRFISLIFLMILSPVAVAVLGLPPKSSTRQKVWGTWWDTLINQTVLAPVFLFFIFVVVLIIKSPGFSSPGGFSAGMLNYIIIIGFLLASLQIAKKISGMIGQYASRASVMVGGVAAGGAAMAGRNTFGRFGEKMANSTRLASMANSNRMGTKLLGKGLSGIGRYAGAASWDARNAKDTASSFANNKGAGFSKLNLDANENYDKVRDARLKTLSDHDQRRDELTKKKPGEITTAEKKELAGLDKISVGITKQNDARGFDLMKKERNEQLGNRRTFGMRSPEAFTSEDKKELDSLKDIYTSKKQGEAFSTAIHDNQANSNRGDKNSTATIKAADEITTKAEAKQQQKSKNARFKDAQETAKTLESGDATQIQAIMDTKPLQAIVDAINNKPDLLNNTTIARSVSLGTYTALRKSNNLSTQHQNNLKSAAVSDTNTTRSTAKQKFDGQRAAEGLD